MYQQESVAQIRKKHGEPLVRGFLREAVCSAAVQHSAELAHTGVTKVAPHQRHTVAVTGATLC
jgi:hypothetical protein